MSDYSKSIMVALIPEFSSWSRIELPHMTLVWAGTTQDRSNEEFKAMVSDTLKLSASFRPFKLDVTDIDVYGSGTDSNPYVDVLKLRLTPELFVARKFVDHWNKSEHPFSPHVTVGPEGVIQREQIMLPKSIYFPTIMLAWGNHHIAYPLG